METHNRECQQPSLGGETNLETEKLWTSVLKIRFAHLDGGVLRRFLTNYQVVHDFTQITCALKQNITLGKSWEMSCHILMLNYSDVPLSDKPEAPLG